MSSRPLASPRSFRPPRRAPGFAGSLAVQMRVIGAIMMRELHTRYGRENIGYLWMVLEPMMLATIIGALHLGGGGHETFLGNIQPVPFMVLGYTTFIMFRGIVNRSAGAIEVNAPLLYHRQVTVLDLAIARGVLEFCGVFLTFIVLWTLLVITGMAHPPERPLIVIAAWALVFWYSLANSILISAGTYENRTAERLVHPYSYFMIGLSGSFFQVGHIPEPFRTWLTWVPLTSMFELVRYGMFSGTKLDYFYGQYVVTFTAVVTWIGLVLSHRVKEHIHLN